MGRRGCASAKGMIKFPSSCSSPKALCNQFIDYYICSRGVFCINHIKLRNFVVITIECSIATVDRGSIMTRIYRWSMMVYSSLQAEFMVTKYDGNSFEWLVLSKAALKSRSANTTSPSEPTTWRMTFFIRSKAMELSACRLKYLTQNMYPHVIK